MNFGPHDQTASARDSYIVCHPFGAHKSRFTAVRLGWVLGKMSIKPFGHAYSAYGVPKLGLSFVGEGIGVRTTITITTAHASVSNTVRVSRDQTGFSTGFGSADAKNRVVSPMA